MMKPYLRLFSPIVLLLITLMGLTACTMLQSDSSGPGYSNRPSAQTASDNTLPDADMPVAGNQPDLTTMGVTPGENICPGTDPHPVGKSIAETYERTYQQVMTWYCSGYSFENILIALETSSAVNIPAETLLEMLLDKEWEEIWDETGFTSNR